MSDFIEIDKKPIIFDDPEFCGNKKERCEHLNRYYVKCNLFKEYLGGNDEYDKQGDYICIKCDECKTAWEKAKAQINQNIEFPEGDF